MYETNCFLIKKILEDIWKEKEKFKKEDAKINIKVIKSDKGKFFDKMEIKVIRKQKHFLEDISLLSQSVCNLFAEYGEFTTLGKIKGRTLYLD